MDQVTKHIHTDIEQLIKEVSHPLETDTDLDVLLSEIGEARFVLLGEASHGTHEYYTWRMHISKRLIREKNFSMIAVEGDWPDCYRLNRYIKGYENSGESAKDILKAFNRWPTWMWANWEIVALAEWLREYNSGRSSGKIGFYGLDVYSLWESMDAIFAYLEEKDPGALQVVQEAMDCFEPFNVKEGFSYAERSYGIPSSCEKEVEDLLVNIRNRMPWFDKDPEGAFSAEQNALVAVNAEKYYQTMLKGGEFTWNIRDRHMFDTVNRLMKFHGPDAKIIIWEHNTHIGDARATDMKQTGLINIGQLLKEEHHKEGVYRIGFGSYEGNVMAGRNWGAPMKRMRMPRARQGSWEHLLHGAGAHDKLLFSRDLKHLVSPVGHRAIGVVYDPDYEYGNYVPSIIPERYEAFIHLDKTEALHPLLIEPDSLQMPETYPWGI
ncbi:erythromycin esterase family protein [Sinomicrobium pectinilyticum]|uniref:erythromycin esterase family protein n=1 Tax=Sinomicrobium pectinilyticum TaxID=1084421 RepID=UPI0019D07491|nr:erythromycin esterase family protein [Sinomicrobium pectinilyticum]